MQNTSETDGFQPVNRPLHQAVVFPAQRRMQAARRRSFEALVAMSHVFAHHGDRIPQEMHDCFDALNLAEKERVSAEVELETELSRMGKRLLKRS